MGADAAAALQLLDAVYELCQVDAGAHAERERWCSLLGRTESEALEAGEDAKSFHRYGPGAPLALTVPCLLAEAMFAAADDALTAMAAQRGGVGAPPMPRAHVRVGHAETLSLFLAMLVSAPSGRALWDVRTDAAPTVRARRTGRLPEWRGCR